MTITTMLLLCIIYTSTNYNLSNVPDVTSTFYIINMFAIVKNCSKQCVGMLTTYIHTLVCMPRSNSSLVIARLSSYFTFTSCIYFEDVTLHISGPYVSPHKPQQVCMAAMLISLMEEKYPAFTSSGFMKT
jgi:hypothetical protein